MLQAEDFFIQNQIFEFVMTRNFRNSAMLTCNGFTQADSQMKVTTMLMQAVNQALDPAVYTRTCHLVNLYFPHVFTLTVCSDRL